MEEEDSDSDDDWLNGGEGTVSHEEIVKSYHDLIWLIYFINIIRDHEINKTKYNNNKINRILIELKNNG